MDIAALSIDMKTLAVQEKVSVAVLDKAMESNEALGAGLVQMIDAAAMERSVNPHVGANMDIRI
ncbi:MAG: YjfB family protein [Lachnospiraceae bacterium]|nr:YjfB family protein [Lachnospiraceae bacterium]